MTLHGKLWHTMVYLFQNTMVFYHGFAVSKHHRLFWFPWYIMVFLPWFTMIYHGLPVSKHHGLPWYIFIRLMFFYVVFVTVTYELPSYRDSHLRTTKLS